MKLVYKGLIVATLHLAIVASLGAKLLYDRATRPRVWALSTPYDPDLPIRGRYVSLRLAVHSPGILPPERPKEGVWSAPRRIAVKLSNEDNRLVAKRDPDADDSDSYGEDHDIVTFQFGPDGAGIAVLSSPVLYFIPEHVPDPSRLDPGEQLWVEVTLPKKGPPRPIRLAVKKVDGTFTPLSFGGER